MSSDLPNQSAAERTSRSVQPVQVHPAPPTTPAGGVLARAWRALVFEHRLPTTVAVAVDRIAAALGFRFKTIRVDGLSLRVRRQGAEISFSREILIERAYSIPGYEIHPQDTIVDVGANVGAFTVYAARLAPQGKVIAVEPSSENFALLRYNVAQNQCANVVLRQAAVWHEPGSLTLHLSAAGSGCHSLFQHHTHGTKQSETVDALTLPSIFAEYGIRHCDLLKLDCEGAEFNVLLHLDAITLRQISRIVLEYHCGSAATKTHEAEKLLSHLVGHGFHIDHYSDIIGTPRGMIFARRNKAAS